MATKQETVDQITSTLASLEGVQAKKMFGEYGLYVEGKMVGLIAKDQLYIKMSDISDSYLDVSHEGKPFPNSKGLLLVPEKKLQDKAWLTEFVSKTAEQLPAPKPKN